MYRCADERVSRLELQVWFDDRCPLATRTAVRVPVARRVPYADYINQLLDIFDAERMSGAFVYQFVSPDAVHSSDPQRDLDMASYGVVKVVEYDASTGAYRWEPKQAFHEIARRFGAA